jgi:hypothetical protein
MSFIDPLARQLERFIYDRVCALSGLARADHGGSGFRDVLASPFDGSGPNTDIRRR